jgi:hypothetical protein
MKLFAILILAGIGLGGCVAVPYGPGPYARAYVAPPPVVVVRPFGYYGRGYYRHGDGRY